MKLNIIEVVFHVEGRIYKEVIRQTPFSLCVFMLRMLGYLQITLTLHYQFNVLEFCCSGIRFV
jgi:hypothetical protein